MLFANRCNLFDKKTNWQVTLNKDSKNPYGTYLAYNSLSSYFPGLQPVYLNKWFHYNDIESKIPPNYNGATLLVMEGIELRLSINEIRHLQQFVFNGNEVIIFCSTLDEKLEKRLNCYKLNDGYEETPLTEGYDGTINMNLLSLAGDTTKKYGFRGRSLTGYFEADTNRHSNQYNAQGIVVKALSPYHVDTLGYMHGQPDFLRFTIGEGHLYVHAAPLVLSNYFLLQPGNREYLDRIWSVLPPDINAIYWNEYFKRYPPENNINVLWKFPSSKWAIILALFTALIFVLFESKRRQRIIPILPPTVNSSVSFAETVGRLYYNRGDHRNLAEKMIQHFLEWVRNNYFLSTNMLNEDFVRMLSIKSGRPEASSRHLVTRIHDVRLNNVSIDDAFIYDLYTTIQSFYKSSQ